MKIVFAVAWLVCGIVAAGLFNATSHVETNRLDSKIDRDRWARRDCASATVLGLWGGPVSLLIALAVSGAGYDGLSYSCSIPEGYRR